MKPPALLTPPVVDDRITSTAPAAPAGVVTVTVVALTLTSDVPATPPNVTNVVLPRVVPEIVTEVPPAVVPTDGVIEVMVFVGAVIVSEFALAIGVVSDDVATVKFAAA